MIVSITTYYPRSKYIYKTLSSIFRQTLVPNKIIIYVGDCVKPNIGKYSNTIVDVVYCEDFKSFNKLIHLLNCETNDIVVTLDDDWIYDMHLLESLYNEHLAHPNDVICTKARRINIIDGVVQPYHTWRRTQQSGMKILPLGFGGILYPNLKKCFHEDVKLKNVFLNLCPTGDDLWFKVQSMRNGVSVSVVKTPMLNVPLPQCGGCLSEVNVSKDANRIMMQNLIDFYKIDFI